MKNQNQTNRNFTTNRRIHIGLGVQDLDASVAFFSALFDEAPAKQKPGYAKFTPADPSVNLSLSQQDRDDRAKQPAGSNHFGIEVQSTAELEAAEQRLAAAGLSPRRQEGQTCCYAVQDKIWVTAPNGDEWEIFQVLKDAEQRVDPENSCCAAQREDASVVACC
tara:strand:+ start:5349 stop:5840 length:492 start_codon:yes stop_codon:yes gene_type:complete